MKVIVCGSRTWRNRSLIARHIRSLPPGTLVIHGNARGADRIAGELAEYYGYDVKPMPADWKKFGRAAGPIRNGQMLLEKPDLVIAFMDAQNPTRGTQDMMDQAKAAGVEVRWVSNDVPY